MAHLYIERQSNREGSRIKSKLVMGALALSFLPVVFMVLWGVEVLNFNLKAWFSEPVKNQLAVFTKVSDLLKTELQDEVNAKAALLASLPETRQSPRKRAAQPRSSRTLRQGTEAAVGGHLLARRGMLRWIDGDPRCRRPVTVRPSLPGRR